MIFKNKLIKKNYDENININININNINNEKCDENLINAFNKKLNISDTSNLSNINYELNSRIFRRALTICKELKKKNISKEKEINIFIDNFNNLKINNISKLNEINILQNNKVRCGKNIVSSTNYIF